MKEDIIKILEIAVHAPSGENCQPWRFVVSNNKIKVFNLPEKDLSLYNFNQFGSYVAHGALIENIIISAKEIGYSTDFSLFPDQQNNNHISTLTLNKAEKDSKDKLFPFITKRVSNRNLYEEKLLDSEQQNKLVLVAKEIDGVELRLVSEKEKKIKLAKSLSVSDQLLFENKKLHDFLFSHIVWDEKESQDKKSGFYIKELALPVLIEKIFKFLRDWDKVKIFNKFGFSKIAAKGNVKLYSKVSAIGAILSKNNTPKDYVLAGRAMQRVWLEATKLGLNIQPVTGVIFFMQRILGNGAQDFSQEHISMIKNSYRKISEIFNTNQKTISMLFRIGYAKEPKAKSLRLKPEISFVN